MDGAGKIRGCFPLLLFFFFSFLVSALLAAETIRKGESLRDGQTLVSPENIFELGFFSPQNSSNRYVGIWFKNLSVETYVWVANRENPLEDTSGNLTISDNGSLVIRDGSGKSITVASISASSTNATLLDNGNFVVKNTSGGVLWQSFDYPTDTMLVGMKMGIDRTAGRNWSMVPWKSAEDPAPGSYTFEADPDEAFRFLIKENDIDSIYWSSGSWNGLILSLVPEMIRGSTSLISEFVFNEVEKSWSFSERYNDTSSRSRMVLDSSGQIQMLMWVESTKEWVVGWAQPRDECEEYNACGPNARCNISASPRCTCLQGFFSTDGRSNRSSARCVRQTNLLCGNDDGFYPVPNIKFPDQSIYEQNPMLTLKDCESRCRGNCSCTAYASVYRNGTGGCFYWAADLIGLRDDPLYSNADGFAAGNLYIRVAGTDLDVANNSSKKTKKQIGLIIGVVVPIAFLSVLLFYLWWRKRERKGRKEASTLYASTANDESYLIQTKSTDLPFFSFATIEAATDNFAAENKLGEGGFGPVYKGNLPEGQEIAIKRLSRSSGQGLEEFKNEVMLISKVQHRNLVRLLGWSIYGEERILIYEYMPNKSLDCFLFDQTKKSVLDWGKRVQIIEGIAQGLLYLHRYSRLTIIHRDLKASNILLDSDMSPKISDFGMARVFGGNQSEANTNRVVGTYGYMSPEYAMGGIFSVKSDVFSFGVLLLEIVSGKKNSSFSQFDAHRNFTGHAWELWNEDRTTELIDPVLVGSSLASEIIRYVQVALLCIQDNAAERPTMSDVVHMLTNRATTMAVPKQPVFSFHGAARADLSWSRPTTDSMTDATVSEIHAR